MVCLQAFDGKHLLSGTNTSEHRLWTKDFGKPYMQKELFILNPAKLKTPRHMLEINLF